MCVWRLEDNFRHHPSGDVYLPSTLLVVLGIGLRASQMLGKCSTNELQPLSTLFFEKKFLIG